MNPQLLERARLIRLLVLDVDGVLTDGRLYFGNAGEEFKSFCTLDGHGIKLLQKSGVKVAIITGRRSELVARRSRDLGVNLLVQGREDKWDALQEILAEPGQFDPVPTPHEIAFMGDDWPDLTVMCRVGLALTVPSAHAEVAARAHWQSQFAAGGGAVREACDLIMKAQGTYPAALASYLPGEDWS
jgi:3-deoxy-D-manno-octulosonate 8-phosphate phosphatase (KDO 8-P phosphatase)